MHVPKDFAAYLNTSMKTQLLVSVLTVLVFPVLSASETVERNVRRAAVRRHADHLKPEEPTGVAAISSRGFIVAQGPSSVTSEQHEQHTKESVPEAAVAQDVSGPAAVSHSPARGSRLARIVKRHMRPHQIWSVALFAKHYLRPATRPDDLENIIKAAHNARPYAPVDDDVPDDGNPDNIPLDANDPDGIPDDEMPARNRAQQDEGNSRSSETTEPDQQGPGDALQGTSSMQYWAIGFLASLLALGSISSHVGVKLKVDMPPEDDLVAPRGRQCWTYFCGASVVLSSTITFLILGALDAARNKKAIDEAWQGGEARVSDAVVHHPGERGFESGLGVALSVALMGLIILQRRQTHSVVISSGLLSQFALRGATLAVGIATILELTGIVALHRITGLSTRVLVPSSDNLATTPVMLAIGLTMVMVGISEELAKACALLLGTWLSAGALRLASPSWFFRMWRVLVESPRALMLAGLSVGCGFMTLENIGYLLSAGSMVDKDESPASERLVRCLIVGVRVGLNLHPWLAGITCARIARVAFGEGREHLSISFRELAWALWPAALAHGLYDFSLVGLPGILALFVPPLGWFAARAAFDREWAAFESSPRDMDPAEEDFARGRGSSFRAPSPRSTSPRPEVARVASPRLERLAAAGLAGEVTAQSVR